MSPHEGEHYPDQLLIATAVADGLLFEARRCSASCAGIKRRMASQIQGRRRVRAAIGARQPGRSPADLVVRPGWHRPP